MKKGRMKVICKIGIYDPDIDNEMVGIVTLDRRELRQDKAAKLRKSMRSVEDGDW